VLFAQKRGWSVEVGLAEGISDLAGVSRVFGFVLEWGGTFQNLCMVERRRLQRLQIRCSVSLWKPSDGTFARTVTENLSSGGFFCILCEPYLPGDELHATLEVPAQEWNGRRQGCLTLQCQVEVVRIDDRQSGIACRIKDYTVIAAPQV